MLSLVPTILLSCSSWYHIMRIIHMFWGPNYPAWIHIFLKYKWFWILVKENKFCQASCTGCSQGFSHISYKEKQILNYFVLMICDKIRKSCWHGKPCRKPLVTHKQRGIIASRAWQSFSWWGKFAVLSSVSRMSRNIPHRPLKEFISVKICS